MKSKRRLSPLRLGVVVALVAGAGIGVRQVVQQAWRAATASSAVAFFAPYVDVSLAPTLHFEDRTDSPAKTVVLGFVVADKSDGCTPTWATYYTPDAAGRSLDLDRRIARLRANGGEAVVSFGGALNAELSVSCTDQAKLAAAYQSITTRYSMSTLDFDIEGSALGNAAATKRRAQAVAALQSDRTRAGEPLAVWLTLPVSPDGLTDEGLAQVQAMLDAGVNLAGVNAMTMDFGDSAQGRSMRDLTSMALTGLNRQLGTAYQQHGQVVTGAALWGRIGATPMIGRNDDGALFSGDDASWLVSQARTWGLRRISMWSANRDARCSAQVDTSHPSNTCSGVEQQPGQFATTFAELTSLPPVVTAAPATTANAPTRDDPATAPYPIWRDTKTYTQGAKVVWHAGVYQAKWFSQANMPDAPVTHTWDTPWRYLGPVLPTDKPYLTAQSSTAGNIADWTPDRLYQSGDTAQFGGLTFKARWGNQHVQPDPDPDRPSDVPWTIVTDGS